MGNRVSSSPTRIQFWKHTLGERLENQIKDDATYKLMWLVKHLDQYLSRWLGFAEIEKLGVANSQLNDVFYIAIAAIELLDERIANLSEYNFPNAEWAEFYNAMQMIRRNPRRSELDLVGDAFRNFFDRLPFRDTDIDMGVQ